MGVELSTDTANTETSLPRLPEPGQVVNVRGATWAVTDVREQGLSRSPADESEAGLTHVVSLQSLEEDRRGKELSVIWELEVGHSVAPDQGIPETITADAFDDPNTLAAFVDAVRWGTVTSADADSYQSPFRTGANIEAYQLEPLRRALKSPRTNLLLADDVGLGKTIEAGLVMQELLLRHRARTAIIVCPPSLRIKWRDEMREKFGLEFAIVDSEFMGEVRRSHGLNANPLRLFPRVIVSMSWLSSLRAQRLLRDVYSRVDKSSTTRRYAFDILVVDEAHHVAPSSPTATKGNRGYAVDSQRTLATKALAELCEHRLFLSATPHNGYPESFTALLEMIDNRRFTRGANLDKKALSDVTVRRLKSDLTGAGFQERKISAIPFTPTQDEQQHYALLESVLKASARASGKTAAADLMSLLLKKRFFSSPWSFAQTMTLYDEAAASGALEIDDEEAYYREVLGSDQSDEEEGAAEHPEFTTLRRSKTAHSLPSGVQDDVSTLIDWGSSYAHRPDSRLRALIEFLDAICRPDGKTWSNERVVVFTEYAATLEWIADVLDQKGYRDVLATIQGATSSDDRETIRSKFTADPAEEPVRVLVATDSAGEGIDLQRYCHRLVNFDVPFNPSRLEQRIGRIDRYGQKQVPEVFNFVPSQTSSTHAGDLEFIGRIARKVSSVKADLGSVNQVMDDELYQRFVKEKPKKRAPASNDSSAITQVLAGGVELNRRITQLAQSYQQRKEDMHLTADNAQRMVDTALELSAQPPLIEVGHEDTDARVFRVPALGQSWQSSLRGLDTHRKPGEMRSITFDDEAAAGREEKLVYVHLGHAFMQRAARVLRGSLFSPDSPMNRVTAVVVDGLAESCVAVVSRLVLVGRGGLRLHEEVFLTGIRLKGQALAESKVEAVLDDALDSRDMTLADEPVRQRLSEMWNEDGARLRTRLLKAMERKAQSRQERVEGDLKKRAEDDARHVREIFDAFAVNLAESRKRLDDEIREQKTLLFTDDQQAQRRRDLRAMDDRVISLEEEKERELAMVSDRYADVNLHVSAAAVVFALTPADAETGKVTS
ncbi:MAG TPA: DISARM system SNF2-like helicase DrmD [Candidatus Stackebrandtia faecavium]|nr:DISARM system SNF2-like helicase DrmD [Candidatus Stackebrandtia faecavium]